MVSVAPCERCVVEEALADEVFAPDESFVCFEELPGSPDDDFVVVSPGLVAELELVFEPSGRLSIVSESELELDFEDFEAFLEVKEVLAFPEAADP